MNRKIGKTKKKFLSLLLSVVMVLGMIVPVSADTTETDITMETQLPDDVITEEAEITTPTLGSLEVYSNGGGWSKVGDPFEMTPAFHPGTYEGYTVTIPDYLSSVYVDAKLAEGLTGYSLMYTNQWGYSGSCSSVAFTKGYFEVQIQQNWDPVAIYKVNVAKFATLKGLTVDGIMTPEFDRDTKTYTAMADSAAETVSITATPYNSAYTITIGGQTAADGKVDLTYDWDDEGKMEVPIVVSGEGIAENTYTLTLEKAPANDVPTFNTQPAGADYVMIDTPTPLTVWATASGTVSYQWYYSTTEGSTEGAVAVEGAASGSYTPPVDTDYIRYYYCVATNTKEDGTTYTATSDIVRIRMDKDPTPIVTLKTTGGALPTDDGFPYEESIGYAYDLGDTESVVPLEIEYSSVVEGGEWSFQWRQGSNYSTSSISGATEAAYVPDVTTPQMANYYKNNVTQKSYYSCKVSYTYNGRTYSTTSDKVYVYVRADEGMPATVEPYNSPESITTICGTEPGGISIVGRTNYGRMEQQLFVNTENSTEGGTPVTEKKAMNSGTITSATIPTSDTPQTLYYYFAVTNYYQKYETVTYSPIVPVTFIDCVDYIKDTLGYETIWSGSGTEEDPWMLTSQEDLTMLSEIVAQGVTFGGYYFEMANDITLDENWVSIGAGTTSGNGKNLKPFSGTFDGAGHTLTYAYGVDQSLFKFVREARVENLNIYGEYIANYGLVSNYYVDYGTDGNYSSGCPETIEIDNVTIKSGTTILKSGLIGGYASGLNIIRITNCVAEPGVVVGYDKTAGASAESANIASFAGQFNGYIDNCTSYATVYGTNYIGGIMAGKGQSMGPCVITNCHFGGEIIASGNNIGGIAGGGYYSSSAPNTPCVTIKNCTSDGKITGASNVGGIFGGEPVCSQCWANGIGYIQNNTFTGTVTGTAEDAVVGGVIGFMKSLDRYNIIENNYWAAECGAQSGIGSIGSIDYTSEQYGRDGEFIIDEACIPVRSKVKAVFEKDYYEFGDAVTMKVVLSDAEEVNVIGYSIKYDASVMTYTSAQAGNEFENLKAESDKNEGTLKRIFYVPEGDVVSADEEGIVIDTVTFIMTADGTPSVEFVTAEGDVDFANVSVCVMSKGVNLNAFTSVECEISILAAKEAAAAADAVIEAIGTVTAESGEAIAAAREAYDALDDLAKQYVTKLDVLENAENLFNLWPKGDVNRDGKINLYDMSLMLDAYETENAACDITEDGVVNLNDYSILLANYGAVA